MVAMIPIACLSENHRKRRKNDHATRMVFIGRVSYGICEECWDLSTKIRQLPLKDWYHEKDR